MEWKDTLNHYVETINSVLEGYIEIDEKPNARVLESMHYSLFAGGKRLRPVMTLAVCDLLGRPAKLALPYACALEMIHTYSLIHDDLPAMDDDDTRRGKPTNHKVYGEGIAILAGDGLLNRAFEAMIEHALTLDEPIHGLKAMQTIADAAGVNGMIGGQTADLLNEGKEIDEQMLAYIHRHKTGALITASVKAGAYMAGVDEEEATRWEKIGHALGMAFQIQDDLLDIEGDAAEMGKPVGSDERNEKATYPALYGIEKSREKIEALTKEVLETLEPYGEKADFLRSLTEALVNRRS